MSEIFFQNKKCLLRIAELSDVPELRLLLNSSYKELSDRGLNYTATYQDEPTTLRRMNKGRCFVVVLEGQIIATILYSVENHKTGRNTAYIAQFAVAPQFKGQRLGSLLMDYCEKLAQDEGFDGVQLDTAVPASHLVNWYLRRGYVIVETIHQEGKTYDSFILEKLFSSPQDSA